MESIQYEAAQANGRTLQVRQATQTGGSSLLNMPIAELLYYVAFCIYLFDTIISRTKFESVLFVSADTFSDMVQILVLGLLFFKVVFQRASFSQWVFSLVVVGVGFVSWRQSGEGWLFWLALFIVCGKGVDYKNLAKITIVETTLMFLLVIAFALAGAIENYELVRHGVTRYAMGFVHPNFLGLYLLLIGISLAVLRFEKSSAPTILFLLFALFLNLFWADSRASAVVSVLLIALLLVFRLVKTARMRRVLSVCFLFLALAIVASSLVLMVVYSPSNSILSAINSMLSGRLYLPHAYYEMGGLTLFGQNFDVYNPIYWENGKPSYFVVDNAYCHLLLRYGIVLTLLFLMAFFALYIKLIKDNHWDALFFGLVAMTIYGTMETLGIRIECNYFLVAIAPLILFGTNGMLASPQSSTATSPISEGERA